MAKIKTNVQDVTAKRGEKMRTGKAWRLLSPTGHAFKAALIRRLKIGRESVAVFRVVTSNKCHPSAMACAMASSR
jgi:hypothetical protein